MNKGDFLTQPCSGLSALPLADTEERRGRQMRNYNEDGRY